MAQKDNILQELLELKSGLAEFSRQNIFQVPAGYFDSLAGEILKRIKATEAANATEELALLSPLLSTASKQTPYSVPVGYFEGVEKKLEQIIFTDSAQAAKEELESLSPLLSELKNKSTYTVPEGYFQHLQQRKEDVVPAATAKVVSITSRKWFRYAAAAIVVGFVVTIGFKIFDKKDNIDEPTGWVKKNMKKVSTEDINEFVELASAGTPDMIKTNTKDEISNLLKDVSDKEIQDFLNDTQATEAETENDLILN